MTTAVRDAVRTVPAIASAAAPVPASAAASAGASLPGGRWRLWEQFALRGPGFPADGVLRLAPNGLAAAADEFGPDEPLDGAQWADFAGRFAEAAVATAHDLQQIAALPAFREAVAWQNRPVLASGIAPFLKWRPGTDKRSSMPRQREELVAHYWQRFCVKNDTIGFFGPVGWGRWDLDTRGVHVQPGRGLVDRSTVYFASWAVDALATTLEEDPALREWIPPRRVPFVRLDGREVAVPGRPVQHVGVEAAAVLARCDGVSAAREIAAALPDVDVPAVLADLVARRWVVWRLEVPAGARPERWLRGWLGRVGDPGPRRRGLQMLDTLERGRERVRAAEGADALVAAMTEVEGEFAALTETAAVREKAEGTAPCRALVYSDCRRSATATVGRAVRDALEPLEPLLTSAGWLTARLAEAVMGRAKEVYAKLAAERGGPVDLASFWFACMPILHGAARTEADELLAEFRARWGEILAVPPGSRRVRRSLAEIAGPVAEAFGDTGGGWTAARYVSPDVMIAADGAEAVARGDFELVLGELHLAANTLGASLFVHQHPDPDELLAETSRDHPGPRLLPLLPKEHRSRLSARIRHTLVRDGDGSGDGGSDRGGGAAERADPADYYVALRDFTADPARPRTVHSADVTVAERPDGELEVVLPDGARFAAVDAFAHVLTTLAMDRFRILPEEDGHAPRVTVDRLVVARETWRLPAAGIGFAEEKDEARRFVRARRWREEHRLPRFVFAVSSTEPRPFYVDFASPVYVNIFAKAMRRLARKEPEGRVTLTEMLPTPEQVWLTDDQGARYASELRFVAVDRA